MATCIHCGPETRKICKGKEFCLYSNSDTEDRSIFLDKPIPDSENVVSKPGIAPITLIEGGQHNLHQTVYRSGKKK